MADSESFEATLSFSASLPAPTGGQAEIITIRSECYPLIVTNLNDLLQVGFDFTEWLADGDTITSGIWESESAELQVVNCGYTATTCAATITFGGAEDGDGLWVKCRIGTGKGITEVKRVQFEIRLSNFNTRTGITWLRA